MSKAAVTVKVFGVYLFFLGLILLVAPNLLLSAFGLPRADDVWIRVLGVVIINVGVYYWYAARCEAELFFRASVYTRAFVFAAFTVLVLMGFSKPVLVLFGFVDLCGGLWTLRALRT